MDAVREGKGRAKKGIASVGRRPKLRAMKFCVAEAVRRQDRRFLKSAITIAVMQDVRKHRLLVRFRASDIKLRWRSGILGQLKLGQSAGAEALMEAAVRIIESFCTSLHGAVKRGNKQPKSRRDMDLMVHITQRIELFTSDAAADEQLAGDLLRGRRLAPSIREVWAPLANLKLVTKDRAHASRRLTSKPWESDTYLKEVLNRLVMGDRSITHLIQYSAVFSSWFTAYVKRQCDSEVVNPNIKDMSLCKARFDSTSRPLGRGVLFFEATLMVAQQITKSRRGSVQAVIANEFLEYVDEEALITLALLADAGDEAYTHTRYCDQEELDNAVLPSVNADFLRRIAMLFGPNPKCWQTGYTAFIMRALQTPVLVFVNNLPKTVGGPQSVSPEMMTRAVGRLHAWCKLAKETIRAEYPDWDVLCAFAMFDLSGTGKELTACHEHIKLLSRALDVEPDDLREGYEYALPIALHKKKFSPNLSNLEAWVATMAHIKKSRKLTKSTIALRHVLARYAAWTGSTCGVERSFSKAAWAIEHSRGNSNDFLENDELVIIGGGYGKDEEDEIAATAQDVWEECNYGQPRVRVCERLDAGIKRKAAALGKSEAAWIKRRREEVSALLRECGAAQCDAAVVSLDRRVAGWTEGHATQQTKLISKQMSFFVDAVLNGHVNVADLDDQIVQVLHAEIERRQTTERRRVADAQRLQNAWSKPARQHMAGGACVFIESDIDVAQNTVHSALQKFKLTRTIDRTLADVFVVRSPAALGQRTMWACNMRGGIVCSLEYLVSGCERGVALGYKSQACAKRTAFATDSFRALHPVVDEMVRVTSGCQGNRWTWLATPAETTAAATKLKNSGRIAELIVLCSETEHKARPQARLAAAPL
jgi:hypothetical protein